MRYRKLRVFILRDMRVVGNRRMLIHKQGIFLRNNYQVGRVPSRNNSIEFENPLAVSHSKCPAIYPTSLSDPFQIPSVHSTTILLPQIMLAHPSPSGSCLIPRPLYENPNKSIFRHLTRHSCLGERLSQGEMYPSSSSSWTRKPTHAAADASLHLLGAPPGGLSLAHVAGGLDRRDELEDDVAEADDAHDAAGDVADDLLAEEEAAEEDVDCDGGFVVSSRMRDDVAFLGVVSRAEPGLVTYRSLVRSGRRGRRRTSRPEGGSGTLERAC